MTDYDVMIATMGWNMGNSYLDLPDICYAKTLPAPIEDPYLIIKNTALADDLGLAFDGVDDMGLAHVFCGNIVPEGGTFISQAYAGHQFGNFTMLGDGRAHLLGEHKTPTGQLFDIQLKGSGRTPFSRGGDGKGALGPMLREYIISEAMHALNIPTTRSLAVVSTGEPIFRQTVLPGAVLTRVAASHLRVGTFQFLAARRDPDTLRKLADFAIDRHYPEIAHSDQPYRDLLEAVMERQIDLIVNWMRVGFIHGVMNTDNMTISGETIDYGPCAFMDSFKQTTVFSSIDRQGRYAFANQPPIANWNLARLAETLLPLLDDNPNEALKQAEHVIHSFSERFQTAWLAMMRKKLGLFGIEDVDRTLAEEILSLMEKHELDYTNTFRQLATAGKPDDVLDNSAEFVTWWATWKARQQRQEPDKAFSQALMEANNPYLIPRNHNVEYALQQAEDNADLTFLHRLLEGLTTPYETRTNFEDLTHPPAPSNQPYQTFCGT